MKYINSLILKSACALTFILIVQACDAEFSEIGSGIVGVPDFEIQNKYYPITTYNKKITEFESSNIGNNLLGYYDDPVFGGSKASFVVQVLPSDLTPAFGDNPVLDSVILTIPYSSNATVNDEVTEYELDSLYGSNPIKLSVFKNNFLLRSFDPTAAVDELQNYYSNGTLTSGQVIEPSQLEGQLLYFDPSYFPSSESINLTAFNEETDAFEITSTLTPSLRMHLYNSPTSLSPPEGFWEDLIFSTEDNEAANSRDGFYNYFRGLYFKAEPTSATQGHMMQLQLLDALSNLTIYYTYDRTVTVDDVEETSSEQGEYVLSFSGNSVTIFDNSFNSLILQTINDTSTDLEGDDFLYLKGGEGSMAVIELFAEDEFGNTEEDYLNEFRELNDGQSTVKRLINEAFLEFYVAETISNSDIPNRVYIYDLDNNTTVFDYALDQTINTTSSDSKLTHLVPLAVETDSDGVEHKKYKIRLTNHLNNIVINDSTNVRLGLLVSSNVGQTSLNEFQNIDDIQGVPTGTVLSPKSLVLHGNNSPTLTKQPKLNIYYTEPNN
tara:strand:- start:820 stop:2472 length:1653 start_codon:yes stop_codon:yes gene_type:complete